MSNEFKALLGLMGAAARGEKAENLSQELDWDKLERLANEQGAWPLLGYALKQAPEWECPQAFRNKALSAMRQGAIANFMRKTGIIQLLSQMQEAGIFVRMVKGYAVACCYGAEDCRLSSDTDLVIAPEEEERACAFMRQSGFSVEPRWKNGHHAVCHHPQLGCVELHVMLYDEIVEEVWFGRMDGSEFVCEPAVEMETPEGNYFTLGYTDHMIFLMLHLVKHFIQSGMSVRMMLDVAMFLMKNAEKMDISRFWETIRGLKYEALAQSVLWAAVIYGGMQPERMPGLSPSCPPQMESILEDLENGGWLGFNDKEARQEGWYEYNRQMLMKKKSRLQYWLYMLKWKMGIYCRSLFPPKEHLCKRYPYAKKYPLLLPYAWLHRLIFRGTRAVRKGMLTEYIVVDENKINAAGKARVQLFRDLDML